VQFIPSVSRLETRKRKLCGWTLPTVRFDSRKQLSTFIHRNMRHEGEYDYNILEVPKPICIGRDTRVLIIVGDMTQFMYF